MGKNFHPHLLAPKPLSAERLAVFMSYRVSGGIYECKSHGGREMARKVPTVLLNREAGISPRSIPASLQRSDRAEKQMLGGYVARAAHQQFCALADELGRSNADLLREAINDLFLKYGRSAIA
jgi:hypothetical protein